MAKYALKMPKIKRFIKHMNVFWKPILWEMKMGKSNLFPQKRQ